MFKPNLRIPDSNDKGQASLEFMLIIPAFVLFILLMVDLGILTYEYISVANSVREGARFGAVNCGGTAAGCDTTAVRDRAILRSSGILTASDSFDIGWIDRTFNSSGKDRGDSIKVKATHQYNFLFFPLVSVPVTSCADMRLEQTDRGTGTPLTTEC
jgi:hypothetical protein